MDTFVDRAGPETNRASVVSPHYVRSIGMGVLAILIGFELSIWIGFAFSDLRNHTDFPMWYRAAQTVRAGDWANLYKPQLVNWGYTHPAVEALFFVPMTFLSFGWAYMTYAAINAAFIFLSHRFISAPLTKQVSPLGSLGVLLAFFPVSFSLLNAEDSLLLLFLACSSLYQLRAGRIFWAGVIIGFAVCRFQFLVPFLLMLAIWKLTRLIAGALLSAGTLMGISFLLTGWSAQVTYYHLLRDVGQHRFVGTMANLRVMLEHAHATWLLLPLCFLVVVITAWYGRSLSTERRLLIAIVVTCMVNYHLFVYDLSVLALPMIIFAEWLIEQRHYTDLLLPLSLVALPLIILLTGGSNWLWLCGVSAPLLLVHILKRWLSSDAASQPGLEVASIGARASA